MASSILLRVVPWKGGDGGGSANWSSNSQKLCAGSRIRLITRAGGCSIRPAAVQSSARNGTDVLCPSVSDKSTTPSSSSPWLMLPPSFEETTTGVKGNMIYNLYSLTEDKLVSIDKVSSSEEEAESPSPNDDAVLVGSSHGWLALYDPVTTADIFLSNPLTRRHIKLPIVVPHLCGLHHADKYANSHWVTRVIISCSPDEKEQDCRAMMTYTPEKRLAFCCPGHSGTEWTPIGELFHFFDTCRYERQYEDFVYSSRHKLFFCVTTYGDFEAWDLTDPQSPAMTPVVLTSDPENYPWTGWCMDEMIKLKKLWSSHKSLVVDEKTGQLYHVRRFVRDRAHDEHLLHYYDSDIEYDGTDPHMTVDFNVHRIDLEKRVLIHMDGSLDGLAMFVGRNHSFALCASEFPGLRPNSIYFTDVFSPPYWDDGAYGGHDVGVFNYEDATISPCYYPTDVQSIRRIVPSPMWFTPNYQL